MINTTGELPRNSVPPQCCCSLARQHKCLRLSQLLAQSFALRFGTFHALVSASPFRTPSSGGGIGGLALAVSLAHHEHPDFPIDTTLYEAHAEISTVGAGISVWPRTWRALQLLGLYSEMSKICVKPPSDIPRPGFLYRRADRPHDTFNYYQVMVPFGVATMHRADMLDVLHNSLPPSCTIQNNKRLMYYTEHKDSSSAALQLHFADGTTAETDVLIGADGIRSATRNTMYDIAHARDCSQECDRPSCPRCRAATPNWTGMVAYRYLIPTEQLREKNPEHQALSRTMSYNGKSKHLVTYPISHGRYINWIGFVTKPSEEGTTYPGKWVVNASKEEVIAHYADWESEVQELNECVDAPTCWAIHTLGSLPFSVSGNVALLGDAAHATETHLGAGAGQAIEDAYILGRLLTHPLATRTRIPDVLRIYESVRLPFANAVVQRSRKTGRLCEFIAPGYYDGVDLTNERDGLRELGEALYGQWTWQWEEHFDASWESAKEAIEKLVGDEGAVEKGNCAVNSW
ncbi:hypothetical protein B0H21DRAFT_730121 [Amylocystis lapponica]|nr:hypothetical protein B0H21DRAFT_730121 [Amylocystis lapponica]